MPPPKFWIQNTTRFLEKMKEFIGVTGKNYTCMYHSRAGNDFFGFVGRKYASLPWSLMRFVPLMFWTSLNGSSF